VDTEDDALDMVWVSPAQRCETVSFHAVYVHKCKSRIFNGVLYLSTHRLMRTTQLVSVYKMY
jgi:hypothetical protein